MAGTAFGKKSKLPPYLYWAVFLAGLIILLSNNNFRRLIVYWKEYSYLEKQKMELLEENAKLRDDIESLKSNPEKYEELARRELGMIKPDEEKYSLKGK